jgi:hypothetical protein
VRGARRTYAPTVLRRGVLTLLLVLTFAFVVVPIASADPCCHDNGSTCNPAGGTGGTGGNGNGNGGGVGNQCQAAPEAPDALAFPLAAVVVIGGYVLLTRRRRPADQ